MKELAENNNISNISDSNNYKHTYKHTDNKQSKVPVEKEQ